MVTRVGNCSRFKLSVMNAWTFLHRLERREADAQRSGPIYSLVALVAALCFINSLGGALVHDDIMAIVNNDDVRGSTWDMWRHDFWGRNMSSSLSHKSYRPLTTLTFR